MGSAPRCGGLSGQARVGAGVGREGTGRAGRMTSTTSGIETSLRSLRDRPFELLKELEKRSRAVSTGSVAETSVGREWVGVAFRMGGETFLVAREETREVLGYPAAVTRIPGAKSWVKGLADDRGQLLPMLDLRQFLGSGATASGRDRSGE